MAVIIVAIVFGSLIAITAIEKAFDLKKRKIEAELRMQELRAGVAPGKNPVKIIARKTINLTGSAGRSLHSASPVATPKILPLGLLYHLFVILFLPPRFPFY